ncbi:MAG: glycosyltransferase family 4 protein [Candidatus Aenigmarchaeota archaeon]|nr:glycosyltransferase family 4 protein [Candidatus Aenigmarchaeota archaeon]
MNALISEVPKSHPQLDRLAETVCRDFYSISSKYNTPVYKKFFSSIRMAFKIPKHDAYIVHETFGLLVCKIKKTIRHEKCKIVMRVMNDFFSFERFPWYKRWFNKWLSTSIDGCITTTDMVLEEVRKNSDIPALAVYEFLQEKECLRLKPDFSSRTLLCFAHGDYMRKGVDIAIAIFRQLKSDGILDKCFILGNVEHLDGRYKKSLGKEGIFFPGIVDVKKYLESSWIYVQPSRYDAGASVLLAVMAAGCMPFVSVKTGNKTIVERVDKNLVIDGFNPEQYAERIKSYMKKDVKELKSLSGRFKKLIASDYLVENQQENFKKAFHKIMGNL